MNRIKRLNIINSLSGVKPANLIGTGSTAENQNLAIFSSVIHLGSDPALMGFITRPDEEVPRHTLENIRQEKYYTINHIHPEFVEKAHYTSAKFDRSVSEFESCQLTAEYKDDFSAPYVKESILQMGMVFKEEIPIKRNGTILVIGEINHVYVPENCLSEEGYIDLEMIDDVGIGGLNNYYSLNKIGTFPYARVSEWQKKK